MLKTRIKDRIVEYTVEYRNVKYIRYVINYGTLKVIIPKRANVNVEECVQEKSDWIYRKLTEFDTKKEYLDNETLDMNISRRSVDELKKLVDNYIQIYEKKLNVKVKRLQYRNMSRKWGSCSSLHNITLSNDLRYLPDRLVAYIVYHEVCHILVLAHDDKFYDLMKKEFPDYKKDDKDLELYLHLIKKEKSTIKK